ncbi:hypothetical protein QOZ80_2BG0195760 [Eleusine coracana subsp. coracana]|nr:hypothetical protein QOZ80_2BG0195760 [Eleusine coracana subsp. coracana]
MLITIRDVCRGKKIWWNEKFRFPLSAAECRELAKVTLTVKERDKFSQDTAVGETRVHVGEIIAEGSERDFLQMKPAPYNIVLEDGTYKGVLKLGIKFISNVNLDQQSVDCMQCSVPPRQPSIACRSFLNFTLPSIPWRRLLFFFCAGSDDGRQNNKKNP